MRFNCEKVATNSASEMDLRQNEEQKQEREILCASASRVDGDGNDDGKLEWHNF